ncbi:MAG: hypothetical protein Q7T55_08940 [Solirubrobacteraceae bacterium]|nr:hypothetical protein [Solirubrobacteraceae bacterium]
MTTIKDILKVSDIVDINEEYKQYKEYSLSKNKTPVSLEIYKILKNKIINELKQHL